MEDDYGFVVPQMQWYDESRNPYAQGYEAPANMVEQESAPLPQDYEVYPDYDFSDLHTTNNRPVNSDYLNYIYKKLRQAGYDNKKTAGILGKMAEISGGDPFKVTGNGSVVGILGWSPQNYTINTFADDDPYKEINRQLKYFMASGEADNYPEQKERATRRRFSAGSQIYNILTAAEPATSRPETTPEWAETSTPEEWRTMSQTLSPEQSRLRAVSDISRRLRQLENNKNNPSGGWDAKHKRWYPHDSYEGGAQTIAYGIKLSNGTPWANLALKQGYLTESQAEEALQQMSGSYYDSAKSVFDKKYGKGAWDKLGWKKQSILTDYEYNVSGGLKKFPSLMQAAKDGDIDRMLKESTRQSNGNPLTTRNNSIAADIDSLRTTYLDPTDGTSEKQVRPPLR